MYDSASVLHMLDDVCSKSAFPSVRRSMMVLTAAMAIAFWISVIFGALICWLCMIGLFLLVLGEL